VCGAKPSVFSVCGHEREVMASGKLLPLFSQRERGEKITPSHLSRSAPGFELPYSQLGAAASCKFPASAAAGFELL
jgi:hypothetical protein